ncbi:TetR/AcrR family transcriptional regulator [Micromonospora sp. DT31]|uniref:TetR/AcrR family transcriptional regulator n=1 Tax=Micromonospora sp. DT31 TaxID=3393434 RepID=UPI003CF94539
MPRNRQQIPRDERAGEVLAAATDLFLKQGYAGTTIADISSATGVARANVYWYFPSKDDVFAAVMDRMLTREVRQLEHELQGLDPLSVLVRGLAEMRTFRGLHQAMHERIPHSRAVREAHDRFLDWIRHLVEAAVDRQGERPDREMVADAAVALFEGTNALEPAPRPAHEMIRWLLTTVLEPQSSGANRD